jgi:DNA-binding MarR family transcriptional regulator
VIPATRTPHTARSAPRASSSRRGADQPGGGRPTVGDPAPAHAAATELREAIRALDRALRLQRAPARPDRRAVSVAERPILACLAGSATPMTLGELATCLHRDPSSVSVVVSRLASRGLVEKRPCPDDRRRCLLRVTAAGRRLSTHVPDDAGTALAEALVRWPRQRVRESTELLGSLAGLLTARQLR